MVVDRENRRLTHFDLDGKFVGHRVKHRRRPCRISFHGKTALVSEINGRAAILDENDAIVAFLGDNPDHNAWNNYGWPVAKRREGYFNALHGAIFSRTGDLSLSEWSVAGRVCKFTRAKA